MRLIGTEEDALARLKRDDVQQERAEGTDVAWELALERLDELNDRLLDLVNLDAAHSIAVDESRQLFLDLLVLGRHQTLKDLAQRNLLRLFVERERRLTGLSSER